MLISIRSCFHSDARTRVGDFEGVSHQVIGDWITMVDPVKVMSHRINNPLIRLEGDRALVECHVFAHHRRPTPDGDGEEDMFLGGRYLDRFERRDGVWKIAYREHINDFERVMPPADVTLADSPPRMLGQRKPHDALYELLSS